ncbi:SDR family oxidoreductase [Denitrobaculum tricleocarpae]|uniref:SDR family oxidoreductase n=1 Tax=Denitrobaculum tricleocarpae TaxID=2591009 RepID=A0A545U358_9PROT|nr:SDR family oxidoreductase [Denitrobaculum tricleocarpae]TQV83888.1 SDR family oxidoreductase [Denitrobaculum tricleocarpae]
MTADHKVALVTGAGSGIGKHAAMALLKAGYATVLTGRRLRPLEESIKEAGATETPALAVTCDVGNANDVASLFSKIEQKFGRLDVLFNNAGTNVPPLTPDEITPEQWATVISVNLTGAFHCTREAFKMMKRQKPMGGRIINNGSISAQSPRPGSAPYTASKHAITGLTKSTSLDGRPFDIACGQIDIGNAATDMTTAMAVGVPQANGTMAVEPTMDVKHVADAVVHMAGLPLDVNIQFITVMATKMPLVGRG